MSGVVAAGSWISAVQGKPYVLGARGPDAFDCYGLYYWVAKHVFGRPVPSLSDVDYSGVKDLSAVFAAHVGRWEAIDEPFEGCAVSLSKSLKFVHHCGVWTAADRGLIVHAHKAAGGVVAQGVREMRREGWKHIEFFRYRLED